MIYTIILFGVPVSEGHGIFRSCNQGSGSVEMPNDQFRWIDSQTRISRVVGTTEYDVVMKSSRQETVRNIIFTTYGSAAARERCRSGQTAFIRLRDVLISYQVCMHIVCISWIYEYARFYFTTTPRLLIISPVALAWTRNQHRFAERATREHIESRGDRTRSKKNKIYIHHTPVTWAYTPRYIIIMPHT